MVTCSIGQTLTTTWGIDDLSFDTRDGLGLCYLNEEANLPSISCILKAALCPRRIWLLPSMAMQMVLKQLRERLVRLNHSIEHMTRSGILRGANNETPSVFYCERCV